MPGYKQPSSSYLLLDWSDKPLNVQACTTLISGGSSVGDYAAYNLAAHVGDDPLAVKANREKLIKDLGLPGEPFWLNQVHGNEVVIVGDGEMLQHEPSADSSISREKGIVCVVLTADCLPVFFCDRSGEEVAVAHAGWRGLHAGIISNTVNKMQTSAEDLLVSFGPAIGAQAFEVGEDVYRAFVSKDAINTSAFIETNAGLYLCDIYELARLELMALGVEAIQIRSGDYCTYDESNRFYSFRKRNVTGRMANLIWLK